MYFCLSLSPSARKRCHSDPGFPGEESLEIFPDTNVNKHTTPLESHKLFGFPFL
ncbi:hypothetical protein SDC9_18063 [bioreactor metagenome]|uniref:Uncharacterized protein n=1 Tax=bioreactor metagenome TaxID=1076179 RepID=A0A644U312_9ZZZZ